MTDDQAPKRKYTLSLPLDLPEDMLEALDAIADEMGVSLQETIDRVAAEAMTKHLADSGQADAITAEILRRLLAAGRP